MTCTCGKGESFETCCGPIIDGALAAPTAEALMRARYSAYAQGRTRFIVDSHHPDGRGEVDEKSTEEWSRSAEWLGLEILETTGGGAGDAAGTVTFIARYKIRGVVIDHRERATFERKGSHWFFVDGEQLAHPPMRRSGPDVGRNDPCPCGSGKKFKKCCGLAA